MNFSASIFINLREIFEKINQNTVIKFLSDIPTITDIFKIIFSLPKLIFIKHLLKVLRNE